MAFLRSPLPEDYLEPISGLSVTAAPACHERLCALGRTASVEPRASARPGSRSGRAMNLTRFSYRRRLRAYGQDMRDDLGYYFFVSDRITDTLLGGHDTLQRAARRGADRVARLLDGPTFHAARLHARSCRAVVPFAFRSLRLHRLEAASMPANVASQACSGNVWLPARRHGARIPQDRRASGKTITSTA